MQTLLVPEYVYSSEAAAGVVCRMIALYVYSGHRRLLSSAQLMGKVHSYSYIIDYQLTACNRTIFKEIQRRCYFFLSCKHSTVYPPVSGNYPALWMLRSWHWRAVT